MDCLKTGEFIRELRKAKGMTQLELAELLKVSDKAVSRWETGKGFPDIGIIEDLADVLQISVAELLKGELMEQPITKEDISDVSTAGMVIARQYVQKRKWLNVAIGLVTGAIILLLLVLHLTAPIYVNYSEDPVEVKELDDGMLIVILDGKVAGYKMDKVTLPDTGQICMFIGCYETQWGKLTGKSGNMVVYAGNKTDIDALFYYPADGSDELIWKTDGLDINGGIESLPRLVYNFWIIIGTAASMAGIAASFIFRRKYWHETLVKLTMIPIALTLSTVLNTVGHTKDMYDATYFFTGIMLLAILIYLMFILVAEVKKDRNNG